MWCEQAQVGEWENNIEHSENMKKYTENSEKR